MTFDPDKIRHWPVPEIRQVLTRRDTAIYALSTGFGFDPMNRAELDFADPDRALKASPSMALVLAYPGFWVGDPATGIDAPKVLHVDQRIDICGAIPVEGEIVGKTTVTDLIDRGEGRGALLVSERRLFQGNREFACLTQTLLLRSEGGFADAPGPLPARTRVPDRAPDGRFEIVIRPEGALWYRLNGDRNPIHSDPDIAARAGFDRPIMHGMGTFGMITRVLLAECCDHDPARLASIAMRFTAPCYPGETLALSLWHDGFFALDDSDGKRRIVDGGQFEVKA